MSDYVYGYPDLPALDRAVLLVDKPPGWTSFKVIRALRRLLGVKKIGHAGTLDPMATGLLICLIGKATKEMETFMAQTKTYTGTMRLGEVTSSYDAETEVIERQEWQHLTEAELERVRKGLEGEIQQEPPMFSAVKIGGERLYKKARRGETIERPSRKVTIYEFTLTGQQGADVSFKVKCSKGTYIRSLAHDFGKALGVGAHLITLRRTAIGVYDVSHAWTIEQLEQAIQHGK